MFKLPQISLISHASRIMLKNLQARLKQCVNWEFPDVQAGFRKGFSAEIKLPTCVGSYKKQENCRTCTSASLTTLKPSTVWITTNCGKFFKKWEYQTTFPASWETGIPDHITYLLRNLYASQEATGRTEGGKTTGSKLGKKYIKAVYCHPAYLIYMQSTSCEMLGWMEHKLESRLLGEISITSDMEMTPPLWQKVKKN